MKKVRNQFHNILLLEGMLTFKYDGAMVGIAFITQHHTTSLWTNAIIFESEQICSNITSSNITWPMVLLASTLGANILKKMHHD
jgi:hypothetical protein